MKLVLQIEPRPSSTWGITLATLLPKKEWDQIRHECYRIADYECVICGSTEGPLHAHEVWGFDDRRKIQKLVDVECLCKRCHDVKHFGRSTMVYSRNYQAELIAHWCKVNSKTRQNFEAHLAEIKEMSRKRANYYYIVKVGRNQLGV